MLKNKIRDTVEYLIRHDKSEIYLLNLFQCDERSEDDVVCLPLVVEDWIEKTILGK